jgi:SAM-dependent methyltransferase
MTIHRIPELERLGLASVSDLAIPEMQRLRRYLQIRQDEFLLEEKNFRSAEYKWPSDSLNWWSRIWEYPYIFYHLAKLKQAIPGRQLYIADYGSGVTFFPFALAKEGFQVRCMDIDVICGADIQKAAQRVDASPGAVDFELVNGGRLLSRDQAFDAVYSVSVLEHMPRPGEIVSEIARILKPGGLFLLTFDVDLCGHLEIGVEGYRRLRDALNANFMMEFPEITAHPMDMLTTSNGQVVYFKSGAGSRALFFLREYAAEKLGGRSARRYPGLGIFGGVYRKR